MSSHLSNSRRSPCECKVVTLGKRLLLSHTPSKPQLGSHAQPLLARHPILPRKQGGKPAPSPPHPFWGLRQLSRHRANEWRFPSFCLLRLIALQSQNLSPSSPTAIPSRVLGALPRSTTARPSLYSLTWVHFQTKTRLLECHAAGTRRGKALPAEVLEGLAASEGLAVHSLVHALGRCRRSGRLSLAGPWATRRGPCSPATYTLV